MSRNTIADFPRGLVAAACLAALPMSAAAAPPRLPAGEPDRPVQSTRPDQPGGADGLDRLGTRQVLRIETPSWDSPRGVAQRYERETVRDRFRPVGPPLGVWVGKAGLGWPSDADAPELPAGLAAPRKHEGDGKSPAGVLPLREMWGYAATAPTGVRLPYHAAGPLDRCVDDPQAAQYTQLTRAPESPAVPPWRSAEELRLPTDHYKYLVVVDYNMRAPRPGAGSCIFLHVAPPPGSGTAGCTALAEAELLTVLRWLRPEKKPVLLQAPQAALPAVLSAWHLPAELAGRQAPRRKEQQN